jgi:hypothetical protein
VGLFISIVAVSELLLFEIPAKAKTDGWFVVFAQRWILRTAEVEGEGRLVQIQATTIAEGPITFVLLTASPHS